LAAAPLGAQEDSYVEGPAQTDQTAIELVSGLSSIAPGQSFEVALRFNMKPHWHIYWKNPGDTGMPPQVDWHAPEGFEFGELEFPTPHRIESPPGFISYAYEGETLLLVKAKAPETLVPGKSIQIKADANWLICEEMCIPGRAKLALTLDVVASEALSSSSRFGSEFSAAREEVPMPVDGEMSYEALAETITFKFDWSGFEGVELDDLYFFVDQESIVDSAKPQTASADGNTLLVSVVKSEYYPDETPPLSGILYNKAGFAAVGGAKSVYFDSQRVASGAATVATESKAKFTFAQALGFAFLGGLILNLMPCVFPVLSIKILGFVQHSGEDKKKVLMHGLVFAGGVLVSFWALAGTLIALRAGGESLGWGFQLQSPGFVAVLLTIMFLFGLSMAGVFEMGTGAIGLAGKVQGNGYGSSFFSGVLATAVATPCTGPFMGPALGFALSLSAGQALLVFTFLGLGMAAPYTTLSAFPNLIQKLPRPGPWMETFKQFMAFPMFATCIWLVWLMGAHVGIDGLPLVLGGLLVMAIGAWIFGRWSTPIKTVGIRRLATVSAFALMVGGVWMMLPGSGSEGAIAVKGQPDRYGVVWEDFSPELVAELRAEGRPVFVDFTAKWCLTCKANKAVIFASDEVRNRFKELSVAMVKADWTKRNPVITEALEGYGRSGVPLYVFYDGSKDASPRILPELLNPGIVLEALESVERSSSASVAAVR